MVSKKSGFWKYFWCVVLITVLFTLLDSLVHEYFEFLEVYYYPIPQSLEFISSVPLVWYAIGKFVATVIIGSLTYLFIYKIKGMQYKLLTFTFIITALLEVRYIISDYYTWQWHLVNFLQHSLWLYLSSLIVFAKAKVF